MFLNKISTHSKKKDVIEFLEKMKLLINDEKFDIDNNVTFINKKKPNEKEIFSTPYTMIDLDYNIYDVVDRLKELTLQEYCVCRFIMQSTLCVIHIVKESIIIRRHKLW